MVYKNKGNIDKTENTKGKGDFLWDTIMGEKYYIANSKFRQKKRKEKRKEINAGSST